MFGHSRIFRILGTPTESSWPGVSSLPVGWGIIFEKYKNYVLLLQDYKAVFPKWEPPASTHSVLAHDLSPGGHQLLAALLTYNPDKRISARMALKASYLNNVSAVTPPSCWGEVSSGVSGPQLTLSHTRGRSQRGQKKKNRGNRTRENLSWRLVIPLYNCGNLCLSDCGKFYVLYLILSTWHLDRDILLISFRFKSKSSTDLCTLM